MAATQDPKAEKADVEAAFRTWAVRTRKLEAELRIATALGGGESSNALAKGLRAACELFERGGRDGSDDCGDDADDRVAEARVIEALLALPAPLDLDGRARIRSRPAVLRWLFLTEELVASMRRGDAPDGRRLAAALERAIATVELCLAGFEPPEEYLQ